jgi:hypothetical protein
MARSINIAKPCLQGFTNHPQGLRPAKRVADLSIEVEDLSL